MGDGREFKTSAIASISSGILLCQFSEMHKAAEFLMGHSICTHHFANKELWEDMQKTVLAQHPDMPTSMEGVTRENVNEHIARLEERFGPKVAITQGSGLTAMLPTDGIPDHLKEKTIILKQEPPDDQ